MQYKSLLIFIILFFSCQSAPDYNNPLDSTDNPNYDIPDTFIIDGPLEGSILDTNVVSFIWQGNELASQYSYQLIPRDTTWSNWDTLTAITFLYLDEGLYTFSVKAKYSNDDIDITPAEVEFEVNDLSGPGLRVFPMYQQVNHEASFSLDIYSEEINSVALMQFTIVFDDLNLAIDDVIVGDMVNFSNGESIFIYEQLDDTLHIYLSCGNLSETGMMGSGSLARINWTSVSPGDHNISIINPLFKDMNDGEVEVNTIIDGIITVLSP